VRIIAGTAKGLRLAPVPGGTRPVSDRAREGLFSSLGDTVVGAQVLDLYAGTGAMGIEALSRGAEHTTFVDSSTRAAAAIRDNLLRTRLDGRGTVRREDVLRFLRKTPEPVDLVLLDPPYDTPEPALRAVLDTLAQGWLAEGATTALTRPRRAYTDVIPVSWQVARRLSYGDTLVVLYQEV